jgi:hypothetical protein
MNISDLINEILNNGIKIKGYSVDMDNKTIDVSLPSYDLEQMGKAHSIIAQYAKKLKLEGFRISVKYEI